MAAQRRHRPRPGARLLCVDLWRTVAGSSYTYDNNGNLTTGGGRTITWNADNRITQVIQGSSTTGFTYDGFGDRLKKTNGSNVSRYPVGDDYEVTNGSVTKYVPAEGLGVIAKRVGLGAGATTYWLHVDRLGSIQAITDGAGNEVQRRTYRPYGDKIADSTGHVESRGFIDQRQDGETGLTFLHARYYDSALAVFMSPDPMAPNSPGVGLNRYSYGLGDPINTTDRSGLECTTVWNKSGDGGKGSYTISCPPAPGGGSGGESKGGGITPLIKGGFEGFENPFLDKQSDRQERIEERVEGRTGDEVPTAPTSSGGDVPGPGTTGTGCEGKACNATGTREGEDKSTTKAGIEAYNPNLPYWAQPTAQACLVGALGGNPERFAKVMTLGAAVFGVGTVPIASSTGYGSLPLGQVAGIHVAGSVARGLRMGRAGVAVAINLGEVAGVGVTGAAGIAAAGMAGWFAGSAAFCYAMR